MHTVFVIDKQVLCHPAVAQYAAVSYDMHMYCLLQAQFLLSIGAGMQQSYSFHTRF